MYGIPRTIGLQGYSVDSPLLYTAQFYCPRCGSSPADAVGMALGSWRWNGEGWEHKCHDAHYTLGHIPAVRRDWLGKGCELLARADRRRLDDKAFGIMEGRTNE